MKFRKSWIMLFCFIFILLLSACGKESDEKVKTSSKPETDLSGYPVGIQSGNISLEYYNILLESTNKLEELNENLKTTSENDIEKKKEIYRKYLLYLNGLNYTVSNDAEQEIDNYFSSFLYNNKHWAEYRIKYLDTKSDLDNSVAKDYYTDAQNDIMMVAEIMNKYQLFLEK